MVHTREQGLYPDPSPNHKVHTLEQGLARAAVEEAQVAARENEAKLAKVKG